MTTYFGINQATEFERTFLDFPPFSVWVSTVADGLDPQWDDSVETTLAELEDEWACQSMTCLYTIHRDGVDEAAIKALFISKGFVHSPTLDNPAT